MEYEQIILDLLNRVIRLEQDIAQLKEKINTTESPPIANGSIEYISAKPQRDKTKYLFLGSRFLKNRLVLAVVMEYVKENPSITRDNLKKVFDKSLQGSIGVIENCETAAMRTDYEVRFFTKSDETIHLNDGDMFVCSQWGVLNIVNFISRAEQLGFEIEPIK